MSAIRPTCEVLLVAADDDHVAASELHAALRGRAHVFYAGCNTAPGDDRRTMTARALDEADVAVFVVSSATARSPSVRALLQSAIDRMRTDPLRKVIIAERELGTERDPLYGTAHLVHLSLAAGDAAEQILAVVARRRAAQQRRPRIAVVAVMEELGPAQAAIAARLRGLGNHPDVTEVDAAAGDATAAACTADFVLVLLGARTGGTDTLARLVEVGHVSMRIDRFDPRHVGSEIRAAMVLWSRARLTFDSVEDATHKAQEEYAAWLRHWARPDEGGEGRHAAPEPFERAYLRARIDRWELGTPGGLQALGPNRKLDRARLYVPLRASADPWCHLNEQGQLVVEEDRGAAARTRDEAALLDAAATGGEKAAKGGDPFLEQLVGHDRLRHLVVEGGAGTGKTVLLQHVAFVLASAHLHGAMPDSQLDPVALGAAAPLLRIPILVEASRLAQLLPRGELGELPEALAEELRVVADATQVTADMIRAGLRAGRYLLLVDSLDEVPSIEGRRKVLECLTRLSQHEEYRCRVVLTSRPATHTGLSLGAGALRLVRIAPLDADRVGAMLERWVAATGKDGTYRDELHRAVEGLRERHPASGDDLGIPENPQLLTSAFLVFDTGGQQLPDAPAPLFEGMVRILCAARRWTDFEADGKRQLLEEVFFAIQRRGGTALEADRVAEALLKARPSIGSILSARELLGRLAGDTGVVRLEDRADEAGRAVTVARPWHRSFQEYLCARRLAFGQKGSVDEETDLLIGDAISPGVGMDPTWEEVMAFLFGVYGTERGSHVASAYARRLLQHALGGRVEPRRRGRLLGLAARGIVEYPRVEVEATLHEELRQAIAREFAIDGGRWPLADRLLALEALGRLGDPRLDGNPWVEIAGGRFWMGGDESAYLSIPRQSVTVAPFRMMWRPVTVQDYCAFVRAGGNEPGDWHRQRYHPNRPVVNVSWDDAQAYCTWASDAWQLNVSLPTEAEWEFAARHVEGRFDVWAGPENDPGKGDHARANHWWDASCPGHATPVGAFSAGNREHIVDLAGNAWEWCLDRWTEDGQWKIHPTSSTIRSQRTVRGGGWNVSSWILRSASRHRFAPDLHLPYVGFRVVSRAFPLPGFLHSDP